MKESEKGMGLAMSMLMLTVAGLVTAGLLLSLRTVKRESLYQSRLLQAQNLAEAGAQDAMLQLVSSASWHAGFSQKALGAGYYDVAVSTDPRPWITSSGYGQSLTLLDRPFKTIKFKAAALPIPQMIYAILAGGNGSIGVGGAAVNSYDSSVNTDPAVFGSSATVWTNATMDTHGGSTKLYGDLYYFTGTHPPGGSVTGTITNSSYTLTLPYVDGSAYLNDNDNTTGLLPQSDYTSGSRDVNIPNAAVATIKSGIYYFHNLTVSGTLNAQLTNGPVVIFITGAVSVTGAFNNPDHYPAYVQLYGQTGAPAWSISATTNFYGILFSESSDLTVSSTMFGALLGNKVTISNGTQYHYDVNLQAPPFNVPAVVRGTWQEVAYRQ